MSHHTNVISPNISAQQTYEAEQREAGGINEQQELDNAFAAGRRPGQEYGAAVWIQSTIQLVTTSFVL